VSSKPGAGQVPLQQNKEHANSGCYAQRSFSCWAETLAKPRLDTTLCAAYGRRFTANLVGNLRRHWKIPRFERPANAPEGELLTIKQTAAALGVATSTIHRWLNDGIIAGEQLTYGAPWRIRLTPDLRMRVAEEAPAGYLTMYQTMRLLGVSRQTVWQRVKRGEITAVHVRCGRKKGLRLKLINSQPDLFEQPS
jgi:predicted DNA-binding transcriptional regulator AlpA